MLRKNNQLIDTTLNIAKREIKVRYANSLLGSLWFILQPILFSLTTALIFSFVFKGTVGNTPYFIYVFVGFNSWLWFSQTVNTATKSPISNRDLIVNNKFPTESVVIGTCLSRIPDYVLGSVFLIVLMFVYGQPVTVFGICYFLFIGICQLLFQIGLGLFTSSVNIFLRDFQNIVEILLQLMFYATPVIYSLEIVPQRLVFLVTANPMTKIITAYRDALFADIFNPYNVSIIFVFSLLTCVLGYMVYKKGEPKYPEIL